MIFETVGRDCLFLNWALPIEALPELESPLRYDRQPWRGGDYVFVSVALFRQQVVDIPKVIFPTFSYPQLSVRLCTLDAERMPSFFLSTVLLPAWILPSIRLVAGQQARKARFSYPSQGAALEASKLRWSVKGKGKGRLDVRVAAGAAAPGAGPSLGDWAQTVSYFERRKRWYFQASDGLKRIEVTSRDQQAIEVAARIEDASLCGSLVAGCDESDWPELHSSWLCPELPFVFEVGRAKDGPLPRHAPAPG